MAGGQSVHDKAREIIVENAQKGELYRMMFKDDPVTYEGIPVALPGVTSSDDDVFDFKVVEPPRKRGMLRRSVHQISWLEKIE